MSNRYWTFEEAMYACNKQMQEVRRYSWGEKCFLHHCGNNRFEIRDAAGNWTDYVPDTDDFYAKDWIPVLFSELMSQEKGSFAPDGQFHFKGDVVPGMVIGGTYYPASTWQGKTRVHHTANATTYRGKENNIISTGY